MWITFSALVNPWSVTVNVFVAVVIPAVVNPARALDCQYLRTLVVAFQATTCPTAVDPKPTVWRTLESAVNVAEVTPAPVNLNA